MTKKNLSELLRQETEKEPELSPGDRPVAPEGELAELGGARERIQALEGELGGARERIQTLEGELGGARERIQTLERELETQQELVKKLYTNLQTSQKQETQTQVADKEPPKAALSKAVRPRSTAPRPVSRYVAPSPNPIRLSNEDIGWFD